jgi:hypothetical protein
MTPSNAKLNMPGEGCGQGAMSSPLFRVCITTNQAAIIALFRVINHRVGNLPPMPGGIPRLSGSGGAR